MPLQHKRSLCRDTPLSTPTHRVWLVVNCLADDNQGAGSTPGPECAPEVPSALQPVTRPPRDAQQLGTACSFNFSNITSPKATREAEKNPPPVPTRVFVSPARDASCTALCSFQSPSISTGKTLLGSGCPSGLLLWLRGHIICIPWIPLP